MNKSPAENCEYCGLEIWWGPRLPRMVRFWSWSPDTKWRAGALAAPLAFLAEKFLSLEAIAAVLLAGSVFALLWTLSLKEPERGHFQK
ncbi:MAG: hypothetical protein ACE5Q6_03420 [Dehalococcoidia bacterium]